MTGTKTEPFESSLYIWRFCIAILNSSIQLDISKPCFNVNVYHENLAYVVWWRVWKTLRQELHCIKSVRSQSYSDPYFPAFVPE